MKKRHLGTNQDGYFSVHLGIELPWYKPIEIFKQWSDTISVSFSSMYGNLETNSLEKTLMLGKIEGMGRR